MVYFIIMLIYCLFVLTRMGEFGGIIAMLLPWMWESSDFFLEPDSFYIIVIQIRMTMRQREYVWV